MKNNAIKQIYTFNQEAGLLEDGYLDERECAFPIEEALEGFDLFDMQNTIRSDFNGESSPKEWSRLIVNSTAPRDWSIPDVDRLDKHLDIIVFSLGSIFKLGLNPQEAMKALSVVANKNMEKLGAGKDANGKQKKPVDFVGPERELQKILDDIQVVKPKQGN